MKTGNYHALDCVLTMFKAFNGHIVFSHSLFPTHAAVNIKSAAQLKDKIPFEIFICNEVPESEIHLITEDMIQRN